MRLLGMTAGALMALAGAAFAQDEPLAISDIHVQANVTAIQSPAAIDFWRDLERDLETALAREFVDVLEPAGLGLLVVIDELSFAEAFEAGMAGDARLAGRAQLMDAAREPASGVYEITATARQAEAFLPEGVDVVTIDRTSEEFYEAAVNAFARGVAEALLQR